MAQNNNIYLQHRFRGKVVHHDPMTNPENGYVEGFYYEDLCQDKEGKPVIKGFIRSGEMIWEVIIETVDIQTPCKDSDGRHIFSGDIVNVMFNDGSNANCLVGFDTASLGWGLMEAHHYRLQKEGYFKEDSYNNTFLQNCLKADAAIRIIGNIHENENLLMDA